jgi:hypothetical protein
MAKLPTPIFTLMCEDIRQEAFGKISLLGVYSDHIYFKERSMRMRSLAFFNRFSEGEGTFNVKVKIRTASGEVLQGLDLNEVSFPPTGESAFTTLATVMGNLTFKNEGVYFYELYFDRDSEPHVQFKFSVAVEPGRFNQLNP